ncbi:exo-alpha-sialidase [Symbiopectobacterium sp. RP]|uniref:exo-alpha-sialidase n=1 Tax=Symbiopectobacterium sp. RP TaxID=3248553 RepID=UPI003D2C6FAF
MNVLTISLMLLLSICADALWHYIDVPSTHTETTPVLFPIENTTSEGNVCGPIRIIDKGTLPMPEGVSSAHASTLTALQDSPSLPRAPYSLAAFWFAGSHESAPDVFITMSLYDKVQQKWRTAQSVTTRQTLQAELGVAIRRIGNPMVWRDASGRMHLYVVATGFGGWAASRVVHLREQEPFQFTAERILPLTPLVALFNTSVLVRALPQPLNDGGALLPLYFELGIKYALALKVGPQGELHHVRRMSRRHDVLQPSIVTKSPTDAIAFMRSDGPAQRLALSETHDAGAHWHDLPDAPVGNPNSSVATVQLPSGEWLVAYNPVPQGRSMLMLSQINSLNGLRKPWDSEVLQQGQAGSEYSYPTMLVTRATDKTKSALSSYSFDVWLTYTDQRRAIAFMCLRVQCQQVQP